VPVRRRRRKAAMAGSLARSGAGAPGVLVLRGLAVRALVSVALGRLVLVVLRGLLALVLWRLATLVLRLRAAVVLRLRALLVLGLRSLRVALGMVDMGLRRFGLDRLGVL